MGLAGAHKYLRLCDLCEKLCFSFTRAITFSNTTQHCEETAVGSGLRADRQHWSP